jgi:hypothetical protein
MDEAGQYDFAFFVEKVSKSQLGIAGRSGLGCAGMSEKPGFAEHCKAAERIRIPSSPPLSQNP